MASIKSLRKVLGCIILTHLTYCRAADGHHKVLAVEVDQRANFEDTDASGAGLMRSESDKSDETDAPENLVKNGDFQQDFAHWQQYKPSRPNAAHQHHIAGKRLMHLHGHCYQTAGGVQQEITTQPGRSYTLKWSAFSGHWDGKKEVKFTVNFGDFTKTYKIDKSKKGPAITSSGRLMDPEKYEETVTASRGKTVLSFFAPMGHCMDIDDVVLTLDPTTTTTPKSAARGATVENCCQCAGEFRRIVARRSQACWALDILDNASDCKCTAFLIFPQELRDQDRQKRRGVQGRYPDIPRPAWNSHQLFYGHPRPSSTEMTPLLK